MAMKTPEEIKHLKRQSLKRRLWCSTLAYDAFSKAKETAEHYLSAKLHDDHPLHYTYVSSIIVTYSKVFTGSNVVPSLPPSFTKFDDPTLVYNHRAIITARNNIYAHSDATFQNYNLEVHVAAIDTKTIRLEVHGTSPHVTTGSIPHLVRLFDFQLVRVEEYRQQIAWELLPAEQMASLLKAERSLSTRVNIRWPRPTDSHATW